MKVERVFVSISAVAICALLAALIFWRVDNFGAKGRWTEFVMGSQSVVSQAQSHVKDSTAFIETAETAGFRPQDVLKLEDDVDEVISLIDDFQPISEYIESVDTGDDASVNVATFMVAPEDPSSLIVAIPSDYKTKYRDYKKIGTNLQQRSNDLVDELNSLESSFGEERDRLDDAWEDAQDELTEQLDQSKDLLDRASTYALVDMGPQAILVDAQNEAQELLETVHDKPVLFADIDNEITALTDAAQEISDATTVLSEQLDLIDAALEAAADTNLAPDAYSNTNGTDTANVDGGSTASSDAGQSDTGSTQGGTSTDDSSNSNTDSGTNSGDDDNNSNEGGGNTDTETTEPEPSETQIPDVSYIP